MGKQLTREQAIAKEDAWVAKQTLLQAMLFRRHLRALVPGAEQATMRIDWSPGVDADGDWYATVVEVFDGTGTLIEEPADLNALLDGAGDGWALLVGQVGIRPLL